jgi:hypothetical protein
MSTIPGKDETDLDTWKKSLTNNDMIYTKAKYPSISVSFDMGWQQRSSGKRYASPSGHAFFIGGLSRKPVAIQVKSKICNYCHAWKKKHPADNAADIVIPVPLHPCTINHVGTSAAMEANAALDMVVDLFDRRHVSIGKICIDDDASTRSMLKWSNADYMKNNNTTKPPQVPKTVGKNKGELHDRPDNGRLPAHVPEPEFVADPNHRKKVLTKDLRTLNAKLAADKFGMSSLEVTRIGKNYGYMIRSLKRLTEDKFLVAGKAVIEHHFDNHEYCGGWCPRKRLTVEERNASGRYYRCKTKDAKLYVALNSITSRFITIERLREVAHSMDTQCNESLNNTISWLAPKNKCYGGSQSLLNRISIAVGINTLGLHRYFTRVFHALGITMTPNIVHYLGVKENNRMKRIDKCKTKAHKKLRNMNIFDKLRKEEKLKRKERKKKDGTYRTGMNMDADSCDDSDAAKQPARKKARTATTTNSGVVCKHCGLTGHSRTSHKHCLQYKAPRQRQGTVPAVASVPANEEDSLDSEDQAEDIDQYERLHVLLQAATAQQDDTARPAKEPQASEDVEQSDVQEVYVM